MPLDPTVQALLAQLNAQKGPPLPTLTAAEHRASVLAQARPAGAALPVATVTARTLAGRGGEVPVTIYRPTGDGPFPLLLYFHGGGFVLPGLPHHDQLCRALCHGVGCMVMAVDYRLAPEAPFPTAADDCLAATQSAAQDAAMLEADPSRLAVAGDSSGGALAAVTALRCRDEGGPPLVAQVLLCPLTAYPTPPTPSGLAYARGYLLTREQLLWYLQHYVSESAAAHPYAFPLAAPDLRDLPLLDMFRQAGSPFHLYSREEAVVMSQPWQLPAQGLTPLHEFLGLPQDYIAEADREEVGLEFYAAILEKPFA